MSDIPVSLKGDRLLAEDKDVIAADDKQAAKLLSLAIRAISLIDKEIGVRPKIEEGSFRQGGQVLFRVSFPWPIL